MVNFFRAGAVASLALFGCARGSPPPLPPWFDLSLAPRAYAAIPQARGIFYDPFVPGQGTVPVEEEFNAPIGAFGGAAFVSLGFHGFDRTTLYGNFWDGIGTNYGPGPDAPLAFRGTFLALRVRDARGARARLLQLYPPESRGASGVEIPPVRSMEARSNLPLLRYRFADPDLPVVATLEVWTPLVPGDLATSVLPVSVWEVTIENPSREEVEASLVFSLENDIGWRTPEGAWRRGGTFDAGRSDDAIRGVVLTADPDLFEPGRGASAGEIVLAAPATASGGLEASFLPAWNVLGDAHEIGGDWVKTGLLGGGDGHDRAVEGEKIWAGAVSLGGRIAGGARASGKILLAWAFPRVEAPLLGGAGDLHPALWTRGGTPSAWEIARRGATEGEAWRAEVLDWEGRFYRSGLPPEVVASMLASLHLFTADTFSTADGGWATVEGQYGSVALETLDLSTYSDPYLAFFFPETLEAACREFIRSQRADGRIAHTASWFDDRDYHVESAFVVLCHRAWAWGRDPRFLAEAEPAVLRALAYREGVDLAADGLLDNRGIDQSYDTWNAPSMVYVNTLWIAALGMAQDLARASGDAAAAASLGGLESRAARAFLDRYWTDPGDGRPYFRLSSSPRPRDRDASMVEQVLGSLLLSLEGLDDPLPPERVRAALRSVYRRNRAGDWGWLNGVLPDGSVDTANGTFSFWPPQVWVGPQWTLAASLLRFGLVREGLDVARTSAADQLYRGWGIFHLSEPYVDFHRGGPAASASPGLPGLPFAIAYAPLYPSYPRLPAAWLLYQAAAGVSPTPTGFSGAPVLPGSYRFRYAGRWRDVGTP